MSRNILNELGMSYYGLYNIVSTAYSMSKPFLFGEIQLAIQNAARISECSLNYVHKQKVHQVQEDVLSLATTALRRLRRPVRPGASVVMKDAAMAGLRVSHVGWRQAQSCACHFLAATGQLDLGSVAEQVQVMHLAWWHWTLQLDTSNSGHTNAIHPKSRLQMQRAAPTTIFRAQNHRGTISDSCCFPMLFSL